MGKARRRISSGIVMFLVAGVLQATGAAQAEEPVAFDYTANPGLSQPVYAAADIERQVVRLPAHDGVLLYIEVIKPKNATNLPVILEASPYHGTLADRDGTRVLPDPKVGGKSIGMTGFFAPRGYAVAMFDLRGTGRSQGCLDHLGPNDAKDLKQVVEWLALQPWSNGRVGMTGHSYVGSTPMTAAAQNPQGLVTIVPSAGLASMYDHQFQAGVPYNLQWAGPQWSYETLAMQRFLPPGFTMPAPLGGPTGDNFTQDPNELRYFGCGWPNSALTAGEGQATGRYQGWHQARDWSAGATAWQGSVWLVHGINDNAARIPAANWFMARNGRPGDKAWIGQWDHGSGCCPNRRGLQWPYALLSWFDNQLKQMDVATGPATEVFMNDAETKDNALKNAADNMETLQASGYPAGTSTLDLYAEAGDSSLQSSPAAASGTKTFTGNPANSGGDIVVVSGFKIVTTAASFKSAPFTDDVVIAGMPKLDLAVSVTNPLVQLIGTVYDRSPSGQQRRISTCAIVPALKDGLKDYAVVVPGTKYVLNPSCFVMGHHILADHSIVLSITTIDGDHVATNANDPNITVFTGPGGTVLHLPVVDNPTLVYDDVPLN